MFDLELEPANVFAQLSKEDYKKVIEKLNQKINNHMLENQVQRAKSYNEVMNKYIALI